MEDTAIVRHLERARESGAREGDLLDGSLAIREMPIEGHARDVLHRYETPTVRFVDRLGVDRNDVLVLQLREQARLSAEADRRDFQRHVAIERDLVRQV